MSAPLQIGLVILSVLVGLAAVVDIVRDRLPGWWLVGAIGVLEIALIVQCVIGFVQLSGTDRDVSGFTFGGYLVGLVLLPPIAILWALAERSRSGTAVLVVLALVVPVLILRLEQVWAGPVG